MADDGIIIDLGIADFVQSMAQIGQFQNAVKGLDASFRAIVASSLKAAGSIGSLRKEYEALAAAQKSASGAGTSQNGAGRPQSATPSVTAAKPVVIRSIDPNATTKLPRQSSFGGGPATNLQRAQAAHRQAFATGTPAQQFNAQYALFNAQKAYQNAQKRMQGPGSPSLGQSLWKVLQTSRFSVNKSGVHFQPLVGRTLAALQPHLARILPAFARLAPALAPLASIGASAGVGLAAAALGTVLVVSAAVAVGKALFEMSKQAAEAGNRFAALQFQTGGTNKETGQLSAYGAILGVDTGSAATRLNESLKGGVGASFGSRIGVHGNLSAFSDTDNAKNLITTMQKVREIDKTLGRSEAVRMLRALGIEDMQAQLNISEAMNKRIDADGRFQATLMDPAFKESAADFSAAFGRIGFAMQNLTVAIAKPLLPLFTKAMNGIADGINWLAQLANSNPGGTKSLIAGIFGPLLMIPVYLENFANFVTPTINGFKTIFTNLYKVFEGVASVLAPVFGAIGAQINFFNSLINTVGTVIGAGVQAFGELIGEIGKALGIFGPTTGPFMDIWKGFWKSLEDGLNTAAEWMNTHQNVFKGIAEVIIGIMDILTLRIDTGWKKIQEGIKDINTPDPKKVKADDKHVDALNRHSAAMDDFNAGLRNGTFGGGERARGAVPGKWDGANLHQLDWAHKAAGLGAMAF